MQIDLYEAVDSVSSYTEVMAVETAYIMCNMSSSQLSLSDFSYIDPFVQMAGPCDQRPPVLSGQLALAEGVAA